MGMTGRPQARAASFQLVVTADVLELSALVSNDVDLGVDIGQPIDARHVELVELQHGHGAVIADVAVSRLMGTRYSGIGHNRHSSWYVDDPMGLTRPSGFVGLARSPDIHFKCGVQEVWVLERQTNEYLEMG